MSRGRIDLAQGSVAVADDALVVNCAADGLKMRAAGPDLGAGGDHAATGAGRVPVLRRGGDGYVEATRDDDAVKNDLCRPSSFGNTLPDWATMNVLGIRNTQAFGAEPDIADWSHRVAINASRIPPEYGQSPDLDAVLDRLQSHVRGGVAQLAVLSGQGPG